MSVSKYLNYWSNELDIPLDQFNKPYVKDSKRENLTHKGFGKGSCGIFFYNARLKEKIILGIKAMADYYGDLI